MADDLTVETRDCDDHGDCMHIDDRCVLCANEAGEATDKMGIAIGIEQTIRGRTASKEDIEEALKGDDAEEVK